MRTGMTMAMFCLVVFALTVMSSMNYNFNRLLLSDRALGGFDVVVDENPNNPIDNLTTALKDANSPAVNEITTVAAVSLVGNNRGRVCEPAGDGVCAADQPDNLADYTVRGDDQTFLQSSDISLQSRARGYDSDAAVWKAMANDPSLAVIDANSLSGGFGSQPAIENIAADVTTFDPLALTVIDAQSGRSANVTVIGVIEMGASAPYLGVHLSQATFDSVFGKPDGRRFYVKTVSGADNREVARQIESALLTTGAQADSLRYQLDQQNATFTGFFYLMQGFMGLGLFVGVAAVGVIAFRTVVERRQQIGMLRALGYTRNMVGLTFLLESAFIAFMGVVSGVVFALILARQLITEQFANQGVSSFAVPWAEVTVISALAFGFALLMTLIPSRQAAGIPIAEALRYE
jgi:putative ABC transport system permease protein